VSRRVAILAAALAASAAVAVVAHAQTAPTNECNGIRECQRAQGPWVFVPAKGTATYLLDCPRRRGIVAGTDALASSTKVLVSFDAQLGAPVAPGRTTTRYALFHAITTNGRPGLFQPRLGCIPINPSGAATISYRPSARTSPRFTTAVRATPGAPPLLAATSLRLRPGTVRTATVGCVPGQNLVDSWTAIAFRAEKMPNAALANAIRVTRTVKGKKVSVAIAVSEALPPGSGAEVQLGVKCSVS
jgi:hypothetical protein